MAANNRPSKFWTFLLGAAFGGGITLALTSRHGREMLDRFKEHVEKSGEALQGFAQKMQENISQAATTATSKKNEGESPDSAPDRRI